MNAKSKRIGTLVAKGIMIAVFSAFFVVPLWLVIMASFTDTVTFVRNGYSFWPKQFSLETYKFVFSNPLILRGLLNSAIITVMVTILSVVVNTAAAYALHEKNMPGHKVLNLLFVFTMFFSTGMVPIVLVIRMLGLYNTFWVLVIPPVINVYNILLIRNYLYSLPASLREAPMIDGANQVQIFVQIIVPVSTPIIATTALMAFVLKWNSYMDVLYYIDYQNNKQLWTAQFAIQEMIKNFKAFTNEQTTLLDQRVVRSATIIVTILPLMLLYPLLQKYFANGMTLGAVKG